MVGVSLTEGLAVLLLLPLLQLAGLDVQQDSLAGISAMLSKFFATAGIAPSLAAVLAAYVGVSIAQATLVRTQTLVNTRVIQDYGLALRTRLYRAIAGAEWLTITRIRSSDFTFALTTATDRVAAAAQHLLVAGASLAVAVVYIVISLSLSAEMTLIVVVLAAALIAVQHRRTVAARKPGEEVVASTSDLYSTASEQLGGLKTAKSYGNEQRHVELFVRASERISRANLELTRAYTSLRWWQSVGAVTVLGILLYFALSFLRLPTAAILLLLFLFWRLVPRLVALQQSFQNLVGELPAFESIRALVERCERSPEHESPRQEPLDHGPLELRNVSFAYGDSTSEHTLESVDLSVPEGRTVAIVGPSGAGKTTIADLLLGLIRPSGGTVLVGGTSLEPMHLRSWRSQIGYVAQDTFLFNDTVRANLDWAKPDAAEPEMWQALRAAAADDVVTRMPRGLDTVIGERGALLSGGERQRLSLARALLRRPRLLILDEATSALDSESEQRIYAAIERLRGAMTILVITHRLSTIRSADAIAVLERGRIVASGTWDELMRGDNPRFRELCAAQGISR